MAGTSPAMTSVRCLRGAPSAARLATPAGGLAFMADMDKKIDPFDVEALEKSLNDSATRVSTIWVSFLIFSLYLLTAATTVTHRQLFLAEPVRLPVLNIDLPLWGFFFLAPILFVILHAYVLIQVILLARTAAAYNEAVERTINLAADSARVRQRLANTLFAQIFADSPREREGWLGRLLLAMAWVTLAIAPVLILVTFQFMFLPYHSHLATWTHRILILIELITFLALWPLALDARREIKWSKVIRKPVAIIVLLLWISISLSLASFPGELHVNLATQNAWSSVKCDRWLVRNLDHLNLRQTNLVDPEKLARIEKLSSERNRPPNEGERTRDFRGRNFDCAILEGTNLRRADFSNTQIVGANFRHAELEGAIFDEAMLRGTNFQSVRAQSSSFYNAQLQGAELAYAMLQDALFFGSQLQGADFHAAQLQWATLQNSGLEAALLSEAQLQGANLQGAQLRGANLIGAGLQGASLDGTRLQAANLAAAQLAGAWLERSDLMLANLANLRLWGAQETRCDVGQVTEPDFDDPVFAIVSLRVSEAGIGDGSSEDEYKATPPDIERFVEWTLERVPDGKRTKLRSQLRGALLLHTREDHDKAAEIAWRRCATNALPPEEYVSRVISDLLELVCSDGLDQPHIVRGIVRNWTWLNGLSGKFEGPYIPEIARGILDRKNCFAINYLDESTRDRLREVVANVDVAPSALTKPQQ